MLNFLTNKNERLDKFVAAQALVSRGKVQKAIKDGLVLVNGKKILEPDFQVKAGDQVELPEFQVEKLEPLNLPLNIVFENDDFLVIDKPAGLVVHPSAGHKQDTLSNMLINYLPSLKTVGVDFRPGIVHRLDEDTSGLMVIAKNDSAFGYLKNLFLTRDITKEYLCLVHGLFDHLHGKVDVPIGRTSTHMKMSVKAFSYSRSQPKADQPPAGVKASGGRTGFGKEALSEYFVLGDNREHLEDDSLQYTLLRVKLHTGRTHQIRVHMAHIGHSIVGDKLYGGQFKIPDHKVFSRQFLHAYKLSFKMPDGTRLELESPLPKDLSGVLTKVGIRF